MGTSIGFDNALGIHPLALKLRDRRTELLAANLANADTPNYKARDLDFRAILKGVQDTPLPLAVTHSSHVPSENTPATPEALYRVPAQASMDGNTVESEQEHVRFGQNALQYQTSLNFISSHIVGLRTAIRGE